ncbi:Remodeling and spacing factor 1-like protein, partial [Aduncisulcus paluster]
TKSKDKAGKAGKAGKGAKSGSGNEEEETPSWIGEFSDLVDILPTLRPLAGKETSNTLGLVELYPESNSMVLCLLADDCCENAAKKEKFRLGLIEKEKQRREQIRKTRREEEERGRGKAGKGAKSGSGNEEEETPSWIGEFSDLVDILPTLRPLAGKETSNTLGLVELYPESNSMVLCLLADDCCENAAKKEKFRLGLIEKEKQRREQIRKTRREEEERLRFEEEERIRREEEEAALSGDKPKDGKKGKKSDKKAEQKKQSKTDKSVSSDSYEPKTPEEDFPEDDSDLSPLPLEDPFICEGVVAFSLGLSSLEKEWTGFPGISFLIDGKNDGGFLTDICSILDQASLRCSSVFCSQCLSDEIVRAAVGISVPSKENGNQGSVKTEGAKESKTSKTAKTAKGGKDKKDVEISCDSMLSVLDSFPSLPLRQLNLIHCLKRVAYNSSDVFEIVFEKLSSIMESVEAYKKKEDILKDINSRVEALKEKKSEDEDGSSQKKSSGKPDSSNSVSTTSQKDSDASSLAIFLRVMNIILHIVRNSPEKLLVPYLDRLEELSISVVLNIMNLVPMVSPGSDIETLHIPLLAMHPNPILTSLVEAFSLTSLSHLHICVGCCCLLDLVYILKNSQSSVPDMTNIGSVFSLVDSTVILCTRCGGRELNTVAYTFMALTSLVEGIMGREIKEDKEDEEVNDVRSLLFFALFSFCVDISISLRSLCGRIAIVLSNNAHTSIEAFKGISPAGVVPYKDWVLPWISTAFRLSMVARRECEEFEEKRAVDNADSEDFGANEPVQTEPRNKQLQKGASLSIQDTITRMVLTIDRCVRVCVHSLDLKELSRERACILAECIHLPLIQMCGNKISTLKANSSKQILLEMNKGPVVEVGEGNYNSGSSEKVSKDESIKKKDGIHSYDSGEQEEDRGPWHRSCDTVRSDVTVGRVLSLVFKDSDAAVPTGLQLVRVCERLSHLIASMPSLPLASTSPIVIEAAQAGKTGKDREYITEKDLMRAVDIQSQGVATLVHALKDALRTTAETAVECFCIADKKEQESKEVKWWRCIVYNNIISSICSFVYDSVIPLSFKDMKTNQSVHDGARVELLRLIKNGGSERSDFTVPPPPLDFVDTCIKARARASECERMAQLSVQDNRKLAQVHASRVAGKRPPIVNTQSKHSLSMHSQKKTSPSDKSSFCVSELLSSLSSVSVISATLARDECGEEKEHREGRISNAMKCVHQAVEYVRSEEAKKREAEAEEMRRKKKLEDEKKSRELEAQAKQEEVTGKKKGTGKSATDSKKPLGKNNDPSDASDGDEKSSDRTQTTPDPTRMFTPYDAEDLSYLLPSLAVLTVQSAQESQSLFRHSWDTYSHLHNHIRTSPSGASETDADSVKVVHLAEQLEYLYFYCSKGKQSQDMSDSEDSSDETNVLISSYLNLCSSLALPISSPSSSCVCVIDLTRSLIAIAQRILSLDLLLPSSHGERKHIMKPLAALMKGVVFLLESSFSTSLPHHSSTYIGMINGLKAVMAFFESAFINDDAHILSSGKLAQTLIHSVQFFSESIKRMHSVMGCPYMTPHELLTLSDKEKAEKRLDWEEKEKPFLSKEAIQAYHMFESSIVLSIPILFPCVFPLLVQVTCLALSEAGKAGLGVNVAQTALLLVSELSGLVWEGEKRLEGGCMSGSGSGCNSRAWSRASTRAGSRSGSVPQSLEHPSRLSLSEHDVLVSETRGYQYDTWEEEEEEDEETMGVVIRSTKDPSTTPISTSLLYFSVSRQSRSRTQLPLCFTFNTFVLIVPTLLTCLMQCILGSCETNGVSCSDSVRLLEKYQEQKQSKEVVEEETGKKGGSKSKDTPKGKGKQKSTEEIKDESIAKDDAKKDIKTPLETLTQRDLHNMCSKERRNSFVLTPSFQGFNTVDAKACIHVIWKCILDLVKELDDSIDFCRKDKSRKRRRVLWKEWVGEESTIVILLAIASQLVRMDVPESWKMERELSGKYVRRYRVNLLSQNTKYRKMFDSLGFSNFQTLFPPNCRHSYRLKSTINSTLFSNPKKAPIHVVGESFVNTDSTELPKDEAVVRYIGVDGGVLYGVVPALKASFQLSQRVLAVCGGMSEGDIQMWIDSFSKESIGGGDDEKNGEDKKKASKDKDGGKKKGKKSDSLADSEAPEIIPAFSSILSHTHGFFRTCLLTLSVSLCEITGHVANQHRESRELKRDGEDFQARNLDIHKLSTLRVLSACLSAASYIHETQSFPDLPHVLSSLLLPLFSLSEHPSLVRILNNIHRSSCTKSLIQSLKSRISVSTKDASKFLSYIPLSYESGQDKDEDASNALFRMDISPALKTCLAFILNNLPSIDSESITKCIPKCFDILESEEGESEVVMASIIEVLPFSGKEEEDDTDNSILIKSPFIGQMERFLKGLLSESFERILSDTDSIIRIQETEDGSASLLASGSAFISYDGIHVAWSTKELLKIDDEKEEQAASKDDKKKDKGKKKEKDDQMEKFIEKCGQLIIPSSFLTRICQCETKFILEEIFDSNFSLKSLCPDEGYIFELLQSGDQPLLEKIVKQSHIEFPE